MFPSGEKNYTKKKFASKCANIGSWWESVLVNFSAQDLSILGLKESLFSPE